MHRGPGWHVVSSRLSQSRLMAKSFRYDVCLHFRNADTPSLKHRLQVGQILLCHAFGDRKRVVFGL